MIQQKPDGWRGRLSLNSHREQAGSAEVVASGTPRGDARPAQQPVNQDPFSNYADEGDAQPVIDAGMPFQRPADHRTPPVQIREPAAPKDAYLYGRVRSYSEYNGYGFISHNGADLFFHRSAIKETDLIPASGDLVHYRIGKRRDGRPSAIEVRSTLDDIPDATAESRSPPQTLRDWAHIEVLDETPLSVISSLARMAAPEDWSGQEGKYAVLRNLLFNSYRKAVSQKRLFEAKDVAVFHSGLYTSGMDAIWAVFVRNSVSGRQEWAFSEFAADTPDTEERWYNAHGIKVETLSSEIEHAPWMSPRKVVVSSFERVAEIALRKGDVDVDQVVKDLPEDLAAVDRETIADLFREKHDLLLPVREKLTRAIGFALKSWKANERMVIWCRRPKNSDIFGLLPLSFSDGQSIDCVLSVVPDRCDPTACYANSILPCDLAKKAARLGGPLDYTWASRI